MIKKLALVLGVPAGIVALAGTLGGLGAQLGIPGHLLMLLWPALVALALLAAGLLVLFLFDDRNWLWPLGAGFLVQTLGVVLLATGVFDSGWQALAYTLIAMGLVLLAMGIIWLVFFLRARWLEKSMAAGFGEGDGSEEQMEEIRRRTGDTLRLLRKLAGRNAVYVVPWFLVMGRPAAGKTCAVVESGVDMPRKERTKGVGGNLTLEYLLANKMIFLDTPGKWVGDDMSDSEVELWRTLLQQLRRSRGARPLDGVVVVVPADDLLTLHEDEISDQASRIRGVLDLAYEEIGFRLPIYIVVTKSDLVDGFVDFFRHYPAKRRDEALGWSTDDPNAGRPVEKLHEGFRTVARRLETFRLEMLARGGRASRARRLFFFTENFKRLEDPLSVFVQTLFARDRYHETPIFRGFYFTSALQGEGSPLGRATAELARALGVSTTSEPERVREGETRSYFLRELWEDVVAKDRGLVARTAVHWLRRRRNTMAFALTPALLALLILVFSFFSLQCNRSVYADIRAEAPRTTASLRQDHLLNGLAGTDVLEALEATRVLRDRHDDLSRFAPFRAMFGMRRPKGLEADLFELYRREFEEGVLRPVLEEAEAYIESPRHSCTDKTSALYSLVYLRRGHRGEWNQDLRGLDEILALDEEDAARARDMMRVQFKHLRDHVGTYGTPPPQTLLLDFPLERMARTISQQCRTQIGSAIEAYATFQVECSDPGPAMIDACMARMQRIIDFRNEDLELLAQHLEGLKDDLLALTTTEIHARDALDHVNRLKIVDADNDCLTRFNREILSKMASYVPDDEAIETCRAEVGTGPLSQRRVNLMGWQSTRSDLLRDQRDELRTALKDFSVECASSLEGVTSINADALARVGDSYLRRKCLGTQRTASDEAEDLRPVAKAYELFEPPALPPPSFLDAGFDNQLTEWNTHRTYAETLPGAQRDAELATLGDKVDEYGRKYRDAWEEYLSSLRFRSVSTAAGDTSTWLRKIADNGELDEVVGRAASAAQVGDDLEAPLDRINQHLRPLRPVAQLSAMLQEYKRHLLSIADDLRKIRGDAARWREYRNDVGQGRSSNSIVAARSWVKTHAGGIAGGRVARMLQQPLEAAERDALARDFIQREWKKLREDFLRVSRKLPFAAASEAEGIASPDEIAALLRPEDGALARYVEAAGGKPAANVAGWVEKMRKLSEAFFDEAGATRGLTLIVKPEPPRFDPPEMSEDIKVAAIAVKLALSGELRWNPAENLDAQRAVVELLGDDMSVNARAGAAIAEEKGFLGRTFSEDYRDAEQTVAESVDQRWAAIELISRGMSEGQPASPVLDVSYAIEDFEYKRRRTGTVHLEFTIKSDVLPPLLEAYRNGIPNPPQGG